MDYKVGQIVRFEWTIVPTGGTHLLIGEIVDLEGDNYVIKVVDSNNKVHRFHVLPSAILGLTD